MKKISYTINKGIDDFLLNLAEFIDTLRKKLFYFLYNEYILCDYGFHKQENLQLRVEDSLDGQKKYVYLECKNCHKIIQSFVADPYVIEKRLIK